MAIMNNQVITMHVIMNIVSEATDFMAAINKTFTVRIINRSNSDLLRGGDTIREMMLRVIYATFWGVDVKYMFTYHTLSTTIVDLDHMIKC